MAADTSVFISYRRDLGFAWARLVWEHLTDHGMDAFLDLEAMHDAGSFDERLFNQIAARPYFVPVLVTGTLERCVDADDWLRREIEFAVSIERAIVPLVVDGFDFHEAERCLPPAAAEALRSSHGVALVAEYYREAMHRLRVERLKPIDRPVRALTPEDRRFDAAAKQRASNTLADPVVAVASPRTTPSVDSNAVTSGRSRGRSAWPLAALLALAVAGISLIFWVVLLADDDSTDVNLSTDNGNSPEVVDRSDLEFLCDEGDLASCDILSRNSQQGTEVADVAMTCDGLGRPDGSCLATRRPILVVGSFSQEDHDASSAMLIREELSRDFNSTVRFADGTSTPSLTEGYWVMYIIDSFDSTATALGYCIDVFPDNTDCFGAVLSDNPADIEDRAHPPS